MAVDNSLHVNWTISPIFSAQMRKNKVFIWGFISHIEALIAKAMTHNLLYRLRLMFLTMSEGPGPLSRGASAQKSQIGQNVRRREILRKGGPCQNAILWTLLFTPLARRDQMGANRLACLLYGGGTEWEQGPLDYWGLLQLCDTCTQQDLLLPPAPFEGMMVLLHTPFRPGGAY